MQLNDVKQIFDQKWVYVMLCPFDSFMVIVGTLQFWMKKRTPIHFLDIYYNPAHYDELALVK